MSNEVRSSVTKVGEQAAKPEQGTRGHVNSLVAPHGFNWSIKGRPSPLRRAAAIERGRPCFGAGGMR
jgi:hypothetical protein